MFSATITGKIKRVLFDNEKDGKDAMIKVVIESRKQYAKEDDMPNVYPVVAIFGHDAAYVRDYAGKGHWLHAYNCDLDVYRPDDADEDRLSFKAGRIEILPKAMSEAIADTIEDEDEDEGRGRGRGSKKKSSSKSSKSSSKSRSSRRSKRDDDDEEEEEKPRRGAKNARGKASDGAKKKTASKRRAKDDDYDDDDYDDDDYDDDDDDYFDDED